MNLLNQTLKKSHPNLFDDIKKDAIYKLNELAGACDNALRDQIFSLIEDKVKLLMFPIKDNELCGFTCNHKGNRFIYINTYLPLAKQIFAVGHEFYHFIKDKDGSFELLKKNIINGENDNINLEEKKANLFSALLLVPDKALKKELELLKVKNHKDITKLKILKLMETFAVPYKTIILRLYEIERLPEKNAYDWLKIPDRISEEGILYEINKHQIATKWQERTNKVKFSNLNALIIDNNEEDLLPESRIKSDMDFLNKIKEGAKK